MENNCIQSKTKVPIITYTWYSEHKNEIWYICDSLDIEPRELYHYLLQKIGKKYDLNMANKIYEKELGYSPEYAMDVVNYFNELWEMADELLEMILFRVDCLNELEISEG